MKNDIFYKVVLSGILICLIVIAFQFSNSQEQPVTEPYINVESSENRIIQVAPNKIGIIDEGTHSGWEQLVIFDYNAETEEFEVDTAIPFEDIFLHPEFNDIPLRSDSYSY